MAQPRLGTHGPVPRPLPAGDTITTLEARAVLSQPIHIALQNIPANIQRCSNQSPWMPTVTPTRRTAIASRVEKDIPVDDTAWVKVRTLDEFVNLRDSQL